VSRRLIVEADGGSRGNPGPAGYGALVRDADTGRVLAGPTALTGCRSAQTVVDGPTVAGSHEVALFRRAGTGWERVAVALLTVY